MQEFYWIVSECFEDITIVQSAACAQSVEAFNISSASSGPEVKWSAAGLDCVHGHGLWWRWRVFVCLHRVWCPGLPPSPPPLPSQLFVPTGDGTADFPSDETNHADEPWVFFKAKAIIASSTEVGGKMYYVPLLFSQEIGLSIMVHRLSSHA